MSAARDHARAILAVAAVLYVTVFVAFAAIGSPALGIGHFFYLPIALVALATHPRGGVIAGTIAAALYAVAAIVNPSIPSAEALTLGAAIRLVNYSCTGAVIGWFASRNRRLVEELRVLAERDAATGLPNTRAFEAAIDERLARAEPFALLIGHLTDVGGGADADHVAANDTLLSLRTTLGTTLSAGDDLARVGSHEFAVLASVSSTAETARLAHRFESVLSSVGTAVTFGWAVYPQEGLNALSLYRAADERLYARKLFTNRGAQATPLRTAS